jgi:hypothetical protein
MLRLDTRTDDKRKNVWHGAQKSGHEITESMKRRQDSHRSNQQQATGDTRYA